MKVIDSKCERITKHLAVANCSFGACVSFVESDPLHSGKAPYNREETYFQDEKFILLDEWLIGRNSTEYITVANLKTGVVFEVKYAARVRVYGNAEIWPGTETS